MDNICQLATPFFESAIAIIRVSGPDSIRLVNSIFKGSNLEEAKGYSINYGYLLYEDGSILDQVLINLFRKPKSYDGEDGVEINCHGGLLVIEEILKRLCEIGFRLAERGEFSKRAFLNKKLDLTQAESIMDIVSSKNKLALKSSINSLCSKTKDTIRYFREELLDIIAKIEVNIDYPEYEDNIEITNELLEDKLSYLIDEMKKILDNSKITKTIMGGIKTAIVGKPNVGKSSLLNLLLKEDKAIVSNISGTTRDIVEGYCNLSNITLKLQDTAGIRESNDLIENIGIEKSIKSINESDLILLVLDGSNILEEKDDELINLIQDKNYILIKNKCDKQVLWDNLDTVNISVASNFGLDVLEKKIIEKCRINELNQDIPMLSNVRQSTLLNNAYLCLLNAKKSNNEKRDVELIEIDIKNAFDYLGEITGDSYPEELVTKLFSSFCLGK